MQSLDSQRSQNSVLVHSEDCRQVPSKWEAFAGTGLTVGDCPTNLSRYLFVEGKRIRSADLDVEHGTSHSSSMSERMRGAL